VSADLWLEIDTGGPEPAQVSADRNVTYNLGRMLRAAGLPSWDDLIGAPASEAGSIFARVARSLRDNPQIYDPMAPENGWGTRLSAIEWCEALAADCAAHPRARVGGSL
jgi:hypothetical protein